MHPFDEVENRIANLHKNVSCMSHKMENSFCFYAQLVAKSIVHLLIR